MQHLLNKLQLTGRGFYALPLVCAALTLALWLLNTSGRQGEATAQNLVYEIYKGNSHIGEMTAVRQQKGDSTTIAINSKVAFRVLFEVNILMDYLTCYRGGKLHTSLHTYHFNGKLKERLLVEHFGDHYQITDRDGEISRLEAARLPYALGSMYFGEPPAGTTKVFSERFAQILNLREKEDGVWELEMPDGKTNIYRYKNGVCHHVEVDHMLATLYFKRKL